MRKLKYFTPLLIAATLISAFRFIIPIIHDAALSLPESHQIYKIAAASPKIIPWIKSNRKHLFQRPLHSRNDFAVFAPEKRVSSLPPAGPAPDSVTTAVHFNPPVLPRLRSPPALT